MMDQGRTTFSTSNYEIDSLIGKEVLLEADYNLLSLLEDLGLYPDCLSSKSLTSFSIYGLQIELESL